MGCDICRMEPERNHVCFDRKVTHYCARCAVGAPHLDCPNNPPDEEAPVIEGTGVIIRIDRYTLSVDGKHIRATPDQEARIRVLSIEQRRNLLYLLGEYPE